MSKTEEIKKVSTELHRIPVKSEVIGKINLPEVDEF